VVVGPSGATIDVAVRRDWAATAGGAGVVNSSAPAYSAPCRSSNAFDLSQGTGWASATGGSKQATVQLPQAIDITSFSVDPGAICGDGDSASVGPLQIETSADGVNFAPAAAKTFGAADNHRLNTLAPSGNAAGVKYVRVTMLAPQSNQGDGAQYMDLAELEVYGRPAGTPAPPGGGGSGGGGTPATPPSGTPATPTGGGTSPSAPSGPSAPSAPAPRVFTLADASVKRCQQTGRGTRLRLVCTLVNARAVSAVDLRVAKGRKLLARGRVKPSKTGTLSLKLKRKLKKGRYTVTFKLRDSAAHTRTITFRMRVLK
jgi:hypothetical protein